MRAQHHLGSDVQVGDLVSLSDEGRGARSPGVRLDHVHFAVLDGELDIDQSQYVKVPGDLFRLFFHRMHDERR